LYEEEYEMAKVLGIHRLELKTGVDEQAFEQFVTETLAPIYHQYEPRQRAYLIKGDRGERAGQYALLIEIESIEARDDIYPVEGQISETIERVVAATAPVWDKLNTLVETFPDPRHTDYVVMAGGG
jgi:hypothetical protein